MSDVMMPVAAPASVQSLLICDERVAARRTLAEVLTHRATPLVVGAVADGFAVVDAFTAQPADLVLIGVHHGNATGLEAVDLLLGVHPAAPVVAFGCPSDTALLIDAVTHGARGIMLWDINYQARSTPTFPLSTAASPAAGGLAGNALSDREMRILRGMCQGQSNKQIGRALFLSEDTIKTDARRMFTKLGAHDRAHAVALGMRSGLLA